MKRKAAFVVALTAILSFSGCIKADEAAKGMYYYIDAADTVYPETDIADENAGAGAVSIIPAAEENIINYAQLAIVEIEQQHRKEELEQQRKKEEEEERKKAQELAKKKVVIEVKNILQLPQLPTGCEAVSLTILLNHLGYKVDKMVIAEKYLPKQAFYMKNGVLYGANVVNTFAGDPTTSYSYGCFAPCIVTTANNYLKSHGSDMEARDISGEHLEQLFEKYIDKGQPVLIWITSNKLSEPYKAEQWVTADGKKVQWQRYEHCVVLTGYDRGKNLVYVSDPLVGNTSYDYDKLALRYEQMGCQAVSIEKRAEDDDAQRA